MNINNRIIIIIIAIIIIITCVYVCGADPTYCHAAATRWRPTRCRARYHGAKEAPPHTGRASFRGRRRIRTHHVYIYIYIYMYEYIYIYIHYVYSI